MYRDWQGCEENFFIGIRKLERLIYHRILPTSRKKKWMENRKETIYVHLKIKKESKLWNSPNEYYNKWLKTREGNLTLWLVVHSKIRDVCGLEFVYLYMTSGLAYHSQSFFIFSFSQARSMCCACALKTKAPHRWPVIPLGFASTRLMRNRQWSI